ncbi:MAG: cytosine deaminase [Rhodovarius sp.]|nr:cytosine deaminase [Rhodovarius sp.]MDW8316154.1 cytosine deaminase [Rhodovarius sp.]
MRAGLHAALAAAGPRFWLRDARLPAALTAEGGDGLRLCDVLIDSGRIAAIAPAGSAAEGISLEGGQIWPGFVDVHTHLDKGHIWPRSPNPSGDFAGAIAAVAEDRAAHWSEADMRARADFALRAAYAHGTVAIRTHLDSYLPHARTTWALFDRLRAEWAGRIELQLCSIAPLDRFAGPEGEELADLVARYGGILGMVTRLEGHVHDALPPDFQPMLDRFFALAEARGLALDLHVDESGESGSRALREIALTALRRGFRRPIQCGHCCSLSIQPEDFAAETIARVAEAGIRIVVLPMCNLYLQSRAAGRTPRWRGVTLVHELAAAGVPVSLASDNTRDPFYAYGDLDMIEVYREATRILHLDHPIADWPRAVTATPADTMGLAGRGRLVVGAPADLVLLNARGWTELLSRPQADRVVLRAGRPIDSTPPDYRELDAVVGGVG